jgi:hypothetical protein
VAGTLQNLSHDEAIESLAKIHNTFNFYSQHGELICENCRGKSERNVALEPGVEDVHV